ncbi:taste receptor, type 2, member 202 [Anarrhichthys ocellatus]|uniref:taste receptor, type 2, member 202 n=1 Tax=Anarrhichthys ocellatus TaxID=433405 RepID=UPI0012ED5FDE|nr:taste receptor type 2 member 136-like [Anarrhichthys ocellatus]
MYGVNKSSLWVMTGLLAITTIFFNVYIFLKSLWNYRQKKKWSPSETIILALSLSSVAHQLVCYFWMTMDEVDSKCRMAEMPYTVMLLFVYSLKFTIMWDTSFLTFYYSTKLVNTPNHCYTQIQAAILRHVSLAVFLIPLFGLGTCMPMLVVFQPENFTSANKDCGVLMPNTPSGKAYEVVYLLLADVLPGLLMMKCCISISVHLAIHLRHMKAATNGAHSPKLGSQMRVIKMALSLVAVFILFLVIDLYVNYQISVNHENIITLTFFFTSIYTTVTAMVLIYGKKTFWKALIHDFNIGLDEYPCLSCLKVPEQKAEPSSTEKGKT